jgi:tetratricopeptide (TPR) repeat protein
MPQSFRAEGDELVKERNWAAAVKMYKKAASIIDDGRGSSSTRESACVWSNLALCYEELRDLEKSLEAAKKSVDIDPSFVEGYQRLAKAYLLTCQFEKCKEVILEGLSIDPSNVDLQIDFQNVECIIQKRKGMQQIEG